MDAIEALAETWASIDGKLEEFKRERVIANGSFATSSVVGAGHYLGYTAEAEEMIRRLRTRGFDVLPIRKPFKVQPLKLIKHPTETGR